MSDGILGKLIISAAKRLLPQDFKGSLELTLPSGQMIMVGGQNPGEKADLKLKNFKGDSKLFSWMYRIATNEAITFMQQRAKKSGISSEEVQQKAINKVKCKATTDKASYS